MDQTNVIPNVPDVPLDTTLEARLAEQAKKIDAIYISVEKTRKYFITTFWITILALVIPLIGLLFVIPQFLSSYVGGLNQ